MDIKHEDLTAGERRYLEHARVAESQGISLLQYYRAKGLSVYTLYNIRRGLIRKGVVARGRAVGAMQAKSGGFIEVRVAPSDAQTTSPKCQLRHPSGWVIECGSLPDVRWLSALVSGAAP